MNKSPLLCSVILLLASSFASQGASLPDTQKLVPAETVIFVSAPDFKSLQANWQKTSYYKFYTDPAMAGFVADLRDKWTKKFFSEVDSKDFAQLISDINSLPTGKVALAVVAPKAPKPGSDEMLALVIVQWGPDIAKVKAAVEKHVARAVENGKSKKSRETFKTYDIVTIETKAQAAAPEASGIEIKSDGSSIKEFSCASRLADTDADEDTDNIFTMPDAQQEEDQPETEVAPPAVDDKTSYAFVNDTLIMADNVDLIKFVISHIDGATGSTLAEAGRYSSMMSGIAAQRDVDIYVNVPAFLSLAMGSDASGQAKLQLTNFGIDNLGDLGVALSLGRADGVPLAVKGLLKVNGEKKGIIKLLEPVSDTVKLPKFIDPSAVKLTVLNFNFATAYDEAFKLLNNVSPGAAAVLNMPIVPADQQGQGGVTIKKDIIDYLGTQVVFAETIARPFKENESTKLIIAINTGDSKSLEKSLALVHNQFVAQGKPDAKRDFMGYKIYSLGNMPFLPGMGVKNMAAVADTDKNNIDVKADQMAFAVIPTHLLIGSESNIEQAIRLINNKEAAPIESAPWLTRAKKALPQKLGIASLSNDQASMEYLWWLLRQDKASAQDMEATIITDQLKDYANFKLLPNFDTVKKYFGVSSSYLISRPDGFYFEGASLDQK